MEDNEIKVLLNALNQMTSTKSKTDLAHFIADQVDIDYNCCFSGEYKGHSKLFILNKSIEDGDLIAIDTDCNEIPACDIQWY